jgi:hypothetical protein
MKNYISFYYYYFHSFFAQNKVQATRVYIVRHAENNQWS